MGGVSAHGRGMLGLDDPEGPFQLLTFYDSMFLRKALNVLYHNQPVA